MLVFATLTAGTWRDAPSNQIPLRDGGEEIEPKSCPEGPQTDATSANGTATQDKRGEFTASSVKSLIRT